jgi:hypothetical protein
MKQWIAAALLGAQLLGPAWAGLEKEVPTPAAKHLGRELLASHALDGLTLKKIETHRASKTQPGQSGLENFIAADTVDWKAPELAIDPKKNPHNLVVVVQGRVLADGDASSSWRVTWTDPQNGQTREFPVTGMLAQKRKAGEALVFVSELRPISFKDAQTQNPGLAFAGAQNLAIDQVTLQVWSGIGEASTRERWGLFPFVGVGLVMLGLVIWRRRSG